MSAGCQELRTIKIGGSQLGESLEIFELIALRLNWKIEAVECPFERCLMMVKHGDIDIVRCRCAWLLLMHIS